MARSNPLFALVSALVFIGCARERTPIAIEPAAIADASAPDGAVADAAPDAPAKRVVTIEFRSVRMRTSIDRRTKRERYANDIEIAVTRPDGTVARVRTTVPNAGCGVVMHEPIATMQCYFEAHGEYVVVERPRADLLRIHAYGQDEALPGYDPPIEHPHEIAKVPIPADAEIEASDSFEPVSDAGP